MTSDDFTPAGTSVLDDLPLDGDYAIKAKLAIRLAKTIAELSLTQDEAATAIGITQPKLSRVIRGKLDGVSQTKLEDCLAKLGHDVTTSIGARHDGPGRRRVLETA